MFAVTSPVPAVYTTDMTGFFGREYDAKWTWRWMANDATWTIVNTGPRPLAATLDVELRAFHRARQVEVRFSGHSPQTLVVGRRRARYSFGPMVIPPGPSKVVFRPAEEATEADSVLRNGDTRALSMAVGRWKWTAQESHR